MIASTEGVWKLSHGDSRARASRSYIALVGVSLVDHVLDRVNLKIEDRQEDLGIHSLVCFRSMCKDKNS